MQKEKVERDFLQDHYLAQIAAEIRRSYVAKPENIKIGDFILDVKERIQAKRRERAQLSKQIWAHAVGIKLKAERN